MHEVQAITSMCVICMQEIAGIQKKGSGQLMRGVEYWEDNIQACEQQIIDINLSLAVQISTLQGESCPNMYHN
ncbi:MAG: hypothetical protein A6F71_09730 [Cycloclasticus sp. symbiont of Poecilosclerida sp. M]|nr:MAG: hypothetical protein A6F71_09730 [Cycloclasticus sp. symbiont of Poecilosclerida sp. M]